MPNFFKAIRNSISGEIDHKITIRTGEITADNEDGTYDVKIAQSDQSYPDVETMYYNAMFLVGEVVDIGFEYGCKESPKIMGHSKKIAQEPKEVEVDYSGGGLQTETVTIYSEDNDGYIEKTDAVYAIAHDAASGDTVYQANPPGHDMFVANSKPVIGDYYIGRAFVYFDTSTIPTNAEVISATLHFKISAAATGTFNIIIQDGQPTYPHSSIVLGDYNKDHYSNNGGQYTDVSGLSTSAYNLITLNGNGRNWINKGGTTKLCLRSSEDIAKGTPTAVNIVYIYMAEKGTGYKPYLTITYTI